MEQSFFSQKTLDKIVKLRYNRKIGYLALHLSRKGYLATTFEGVISLITTEELRNHHNRVVKRIKDLDALNDRTKGRLAVTFWAFYEPLPEPLDPATQQTAMAEYQAKISQWLLQAEQDIVERLEDQLWSSDERLRCICAAMSLKERLNSLIEATIDLQPDGLAIVWEGLQLKTEYTPAGIIRANYLVCLLEDACQDIMHTYYTLRLLTPRSLKADDELLALAADTACSARNLRLTDGIDRFCGHDVSWHLYQ